MEGPGGKAVCVHERKQRNEGKLAAEVGHLREAHRHVREVGLVAYGPPVGVSRHANCARHANEPLVGLPADAVAAVRIGLPLLSPQLAAQEFVGILQPIPVG